MMPPVRRTGRGVGADQHRRREPEEETARRRRRGPEEEVDQRRRREPEGEAELRHRRGPEAETGRRRREPVEEPEYDEEPYDEEPYDEDRYGEGEEFHDSDEAYADEDRDERRERADRRRRRPRLPAARAAREGLRQIVELTGRDVNGVVAVQPGEDGWVVGVEVVEAHRIPASVDLLALYEVAIDHDGELLGYRRVRRYPRGKSEVS